jgi:hypothetical protein
LYDFLDYLKELKEERDIEFLFIDTPQIRLDVEMGISNKIYKILEEEGFDCVHYYDENSEESLMLTPADVVENDFGFTFDMTLYNALLEKSFELLRPYCYISTEVITMRYSIFNMMQYFGESAHLFCYKNALSNKSKSSPNCSCCCTTQINDNTGETWYDLNPMPKCTPTWSLDDGIEYFSSNFLKMLLSGKIDTDDYCELIIFNYMHDISMKIDRKEIIDHLDRNEHCYYFLPMIIYIIGKMYKKYFVSEKEIEV